MKHFSTWMKLVRKSIIIKQHSLTLGGPPVSSNSIKTTLLILGITMGFLGLVEGIGRVAIRYVELKRPSGIFGEKILSHQEPMLGFGLKKGVNEDMGGWAVKTNLLGFRDSELTFEKPSDEIRIFIIGGSTVFGWGVNQPETIPSIIQNRMKEFSGKRIRIINAGIPWYASWHEAALVFFKISEMNPDWIISVDALNDTAQGVAPLWEPVSRGFLDPPTKVAFERLHTRGGARLLFSDLLSLSQTYTYFSSKLKGREGISKGSYHPELWDQYVSLKEKIEVLSSAKGIRFTTFFQPVIVTGKNLTEEESRNNETNMRLPDFAEVFKNTYLEGEKRGLAAKTFRFISLKDAFKEVKETIYIDGQHYNARGNEILANEIIVKEILPNLKKLTTESNSRT
ncbi:MAG: SGNH/GDSL hydrolase family protein [Proteobacteria bacterium]|nr:SGNH/GDSL hydrolase family protein [Pseudomonadota bacterium]NBY21252.1 SGNH/GDSL hydrolase family protein [bacterium]